MVVSLLVGGFKYSIVIHSSINTAFLLRITMDTIDVVVDDGCIPHLIDGYKSDKCVTSISGGESSEPCEPRACKQGWYR